MADWTNSQMLGEVSPDDKLQGPVTLANIQATLEANSKKVILRQVLIGVAVGVGFMIINKRR